MADPGFRRAGPQDIERTYAIRAATRENPIPRSTLIELGFDPETVRRKLSEGAYFSWVHESVGALTGFCTGDAGTGEILALAVLPAYEGRGIGRELLSRVVADLRACGAARIWLAASADPRVRAHGFYRANGWKPVGRMLDNGDEELELREGP